ncbi:nitroreductase family protein [candidate division CSSED10-310 bacterium]|uniref:Nitroreductase family protein n=1 Tax=candidate division CSSED10-310 bacterium TaxID=2855610 RepID=A0ABV6YTN7_UNCC1
MSGIVFLKTQKLDLLKEFYVNQVECQLWLDQGDCCIFQHGNFLFGFCSSGEVDKAGILTFFFDDPGDVQQCYQRLAQIATSQPKTNDKFRIFHFYARDPEGRDIEFQSFSHDIDRFRTGEELLLTRRSIRKFKAKIVSDEVIQDLVEISRFAPTSNNTQSYYFMFIKDRKLLNWLADVRGACSTPIAAAPIAVAICADPAVSGAYEQDGCIAAYHFMLAAWHFSLGTCWIAAMDRKDVKHKLGIPENHYIATLSPLGYPAEKAVTPIRKEKTWFMRNPGREGSELTP